jgi:hypothetical protein
MILGLLGPDCTPPQCCLTGCDHQREQRFCVCPYGVSYVQIIQLLTSCVSLSGNLHLAEAVTCGLFEGWRAVDVVYQRHLTTVARAL